MWLSCDSLSNSFWFPCTFVLLSPILLLSTLHADLWFIILLIHYCLPANKHSLIPFSLLSPSVVIIGRIKGLISQCESPGVPVRCRRKGISKKRSSKGVTTERKGGWGRWQETMRKVRGKAALCRAKCCNHPPPGRKVRNVKLSQVFRELRGG